MSTSPVGASLHARQRPRLLLRCLTALALVVPTLAVFAPTAHATVIFNPSFNSSAPGTFAVPGTLYAKQGGVVELGAGTTGDVQCVQVTGAFTAIQTQAGGRVYWTFPFTAGRGDGLQTVTMSAYTGFDANGCTGDPVSRQASFVLDNTGPVVTGALAPPPNQDGWNNSDVTITWSATDTSSGLASGPTPATDAQTTETAGATRVAVATDRLGNVGTGAVSVKLDKGVPVIAASRSPAPNAAGWNSGKDGPVTVSFSCYDVLSGIASCPGPATLSNNAANQSVSGTAVDNAGNTSTASISGINVDTVPPTLSGAPTTAPGPAGWYTDDVTIHWTAADDLSGLAGPAPSDTTITSEGAAQTASASVSDKAGNTTTVSSGAVKIDKTAPVTTATTPTDWTTVGVTVPLKAADGLSGVAATYYQLDGGLIRTGTSVPIAADGVHDLKFWSVDTAGNAETARTVQVKIDTTAPSIHHTASPVANNAGWNQGSVTVSFTCSDTGSGIASCSSPENVTKEGANQQVIGTATDVAGNSATDTATVNIDTTPPTVKATADRLPNDHGWYDGNVIVTFSCDDALSGIADCPAAQTVSEGAASSVTGKARDVADNTAVASVTGIDVDTTPPSLSGAIVTDGAHNGWYTGDVTVHWTAKDDLSGIDGAGPSDSVVKGEGANLSASAPVSDRAGNTTNATVTGIKIDRTPPSTQVSVPDAPTGWYSGKVLVTLTAGADLSGIDATYYSVDGGPAQTYTGPFSHSLTGAHTLTFWSVDKAGNIEDQTAPGHSITLKVDGAAPAITGTRTPDPNENGWNNVAVTVSFTCTDQGTGIASCSSPTTLDSEGIGQSVTGQAQDLVGATSKATVGNINIDKTAPTIKGAASGTMGQNGWYTSPVTVTFDCADQGTVQSGIATCGPQTTLSTDGGGQSVAGKAVDKADNTASTTVSGINIDTTKPAISNPGFKDVYTLGDPAIPTSATACTATDTGSGLDSCVLTITGGQPNGVGTFTFTATATDRAGNTATRTGTYKVIYRWDGFLQPINDTAHQLNLGLSVFKGGSTVPAKFQLKRADGTVVQANRAPQWLTPVQGSLTTALVSELLFSDAETTGSDFRWDAGGQQYQYNWSTKGSATGYQYQVRVALDDGQVYSVTLGLR